MNGLAVGLQPRGIHDDAKPVLSVHDGPAASSRQSCAHHRIATSAIRRNDHGYDERRRCARDLKVVITFYLTTLNYMYS